MYRFGSASGHLVILLCCSLRTCGTYIALRLLIHEPTECLSSDGYQRRRDHRRVSERDQAGHVLCASACPFAALKFLYQFNVL